MFPYVATMVFIQLRFLESKIQIIIKLLVKIHRSDAKPINRISPDKIL